MNADHQDVERTFLDFLLHGLQEVTIRLNNNSGPTAELQAATSHHWASIEGNSMAAAPSGSNHP
jgi:hypothetical protein